MLSKLRLNSERSAVRRLVNAGLISSLPDALVQSKDIRRLRSDFHRAWSIVLLSAAPWYILSYSCGQNVPWRLYKRGHSSAATPLRWLWHRAGSLTSGSHASLFPLTSVSFTPPLNLKPLSFQLPPPNLLLPFALHTHTNKEMGPLQFILLALWSLDLYRGEEGKIIGRSFN